MMALRMLGTTVYASDNLTPNGLMHVHRLGEGTLHYLKGVSELHLVLQASRSAS